MRLTRCLFWTLLVAAGFALLAQPGSVRARQKDKDDLPRKPSAVFSEVSNLKTGGVTDVAKAKATFQTFATYHAEIIAHPKVHAAPLEFKADNPFVAKPPTVDEIITDLSRAILVPEPGARAQVGPKDADYIRELGAALDAALAKVVRENTEPVVRINAMRLLAAACRSGAHAHYPTVTSLITNANTPPEIRYYAFQAAANLLAAYDLNYYEYRTHSNDPKVVAELIKALEAAITNPATLVPLPPAEKDKPAVIPTDQVAVVQFIRRQAVRALAQVRFAEFEVAKGGPTLYPGFTLARIAVSDPGINPPPTQPAEVAEAVIGLCNMAPPRQKGTEKYAFAITDAVATGLITFATPRAANPGDKTIPWKGTAARLNDALKGWRPLFDPGYNPLKPTAFLADLVPKPVATLIGEADRQVLGPLEKADAGTKVNVDSLRTFRQDLRKQKEWSPAPFLTNEKLVLPVKD
jgi:hypothetical protein